MLVLLALMVTGGFGFLEGMLYANRKLTVLLANDVCFSSWSGLTALNDPVNRRFTTLLDRQMDFSAAKLADMARKYPGLIERSHYNLLVRVRDYRKKHGHEAERSSDYDPADMDRRIAEAIAFRESIHNTNQWGIPTLDDVIQHSKGQR